MQKHSMQKAGFNCGGENNAETKADDSNLCNLGLGLRALLRRHSSMETQDVEQGFAAHVSQHHTEGKGGNHRAKHHQHTYFISHNGPSNLEFWLFPWCVFCALS
jgi:hypothetical protein